MNETKNYFIIISEPVREHCIQAIKTLPYGYEVVIRKKDKKRTNQQNKYYWGVVLETFSNETGFTKEELHHQFAAKFIGVNRFTVKDESGEDIELAIPKSTTELSTEAFNEYIDKIAGAG